jgi:L-alanine-DL-glutamate epimerase-like enolase superfamily enzyme
MIITEVNTYLMILDFKIKIGAMPALKVSSLIIKIQTDEDVEGWGLAHWNLSNAGAKKLVDESLSRLLIRKDPFMVEEIYHLIYHSSNRIMFGIPQVTSAIQVALWDIIGKTTKQPIYRLLGGMKKKVRTYASLFRPYKPKAAIGAVQTALDLGGYSAVKLRIGQSIKKDELLIKEVRDCYPDLTIMLDANSGYENVNDALKIAKICDKYDIAWFEEPIPSDNLNGLARLREQSPVQIAGGENDMGIFRFEDILSKGCYDIIQPDVSRSGGFLQLKKIDAMAEVKGVRLIPHTFGHGLQLAANIHYTMASRADWLEFPFFPEEFQVLEEPLRVEKGYVNAIEKPGLGVEINRKTFEENIVN